MMEGTTHNALVSSRVYFPRGYHTKHFVLYLFICQGTWNRRKRSDLFGLRTKLPPATASL